LKVDVCVPVLQKPSSAFEEMLKREIPVHDIFYSYTVPLGTARQELIERVGTEYFAFIDSDIELLPGWFSKMWSLFDGPNVGGADGMWSYTVEPEVDAYTDAMRDLAHLLGKKTAVEKIARAFYGDVLIRTESVKGIRIPPIPIYEDEFIRRYIVSRGFNWKRLQEVVCLHHRKLNVGQAWASGFYSYKFGMMSAEQAVRNLVTIIPKSLYAVAKTGMWKIVPMQLDREIRTSLGCLAAWAKGDRFKGGT
jgi:glycosyltransferase involved in cell wall biosynthesis